MDRSALVLRPGLASLFRLAGASLSTLILAAGSSWAAPLGSANHQSQGAMRPDQVHVFNARTARRSVVTGTVVENALTRVRVEREGRETRVDPLEVERIVWGESSPAFREAQVYFDRGDFENAAARYRQATAVEQRKVIQAVARRRTGESLVELGARDPSKYTEALSEFERFLVDHPDDRSVPDVRTLTARTMLLAGDAKAAGTLYRAIYEAGAGETPSSGYDTMLCARAGLAAAEAFLAAGETLPARELFGVLKSALASMKSTLPESSPEAAEITALADEAELGEGFVLIANGQVPQAVTFFEGKLRGEGLRSTIRFGATFGLAEALLAERKLSEARIHFARVAAIDHTNRDRTARALLRLAQTTSELREPDAKQRARRWLTEIAQNYGSTPSARAARELADTL